MTTMCLVIVAVTVYMVGLGIVMSLAIWGLGDE